MVLGHQPFCPHKLTFVVRSHQVDVVFVIILPYDFELYFILQIILYFDILSEILRIYLNSSGYCRQQSLFKAFCIVKYRYYVDQNHI